VVKRGLDLKILMITERYHPIWGGAENQLRQLIPHLQERGCDIKVVTRRWHQDYSAREIVEGAEVIRLGNPGDGFLATLCFIVSLSWYIFSRRNQIDILHSHGAVKMGSLCALWSWLLGCKNVAKIATADRIPRLYGRLSGRIILALFKNSSAIISMTDEIDSELAEIDIQKERVFRIINGVDGKRFKPAGSEARVAWRRSRNLDAECPIILFSSRLVPRKGLDILLEAWPEIISRYPEAQLFIVGSGNDQPDSVEALLRQRVIDEKIGNITFVGETGTPELYLGVSDIFIFPSRREGYPNALIEAMVSGVAVVASDIGGVTAVLNNSLAALTFKSEDPDELAEGVLKLLSDREYARNLGNEARQLMLARNSFQGISSQYYQLYATMLATGSQ
jgi:glycosyltransferase involved in cell wall biosynthesis